jgi:hypothetical protein
MRTMKKRLGIAFAGAALAAGVMGGAAFAQPTGPSLPDAACTRLTQQIDLLSNAEATADSLGRTALADRLDARITKLQTRADNLDC